MERHWSLEQCSMLHSHLQCLAASSPPPLSPAAQDSLPLASVNWLAPPRQYPATLIAFLHSLRVGLPDSCIPLCDPSDLDALTIFFSGPSIAAIC